MFTGVSLQMQGAVTLKVYDVCEYCPAAVSGCSCKEHRTRSSGWAAQRTQEQQVILSVTTCERQIVVLSVSPTVNDRLQHNMTSPAPQTSSALLVLSLIIDGNHGHRSVINTTFVLTANAVELSGVDLGDDSVQRVHIDSHIVQT